ncbi:MAG: winged helix-turn-helix transcriptional regulator [Oligoflexales bacterium]|nr:winged helix-turn-helix transcriptional regulator [Oligoflexales bacterium]
MGGGKINLTLKEYDLLEYIVRHQNKIIGRDVIARDVWHDAGRATSLNNVIDVHIARLRKKVDQDFFTKIIHTVRGIGFIAQTRQGGDDLEEA